MLKAFVVMVLKGHSERGLETFLRNYPFWSRLCEFKEKLPCHATFSNFKRRIGGDTLKKVMKEHGSCRYRSEMGLYTGWVHCVPKLFQLYVK